MDKLISLQQAIDTLRAMQTYKMFAGDDMILVDKAEVQTELMMLPSAQSEPEAISKWKKEFRKYVDSLDIARDDWKGIIEYIDEVPSIQPVQRWVPCSERLPEKEGWYITTVESEKTGKRRIENDLFAVDIALAHGHTPNKFCKDGYKQKNCCVDAISRTISGRR